MQAASGRRRENRKLRAGPHWEGTLKILDRDLGLLVVPVQPLASGYVGMAALITLTSGLMMTGTLALYLFGTARRTFRLEALTARLLATTKELGLSNVLLATVAENSPEGILVDSDTNETILANTPLKKMLNVASDDAVPHDAASWLQLVLSNVKNPDEFLDRIRYLYANPAVVSSEEVEFKNGRVFDRYTRLLYDGSGINLGRAWFIRDITERVRAEQALRRYNALLDAMTMSVATLLTKKSLAEAVPIALAHIGEAVEDVRILIIERMEEPDGRHRHRVAYEWNSSRWAGVGRSSVVREITARFARIGGVVCAAGRRKDGRHDARDGKRGGQGAVARHGRSIAAVRADIHGRELVGICHIRGR